MGWFKKKPDPISDRARALNDKIAALEAQIQRLSGGKPEPSQAGPRLRSTTLPHGAASTPAPQTASVPAAPLPPREPIFEDVDQRRLQTHAEPDFTPDHYNDLGMRKYDLPALWRRIQNHFRGPPTANPKLVNYLAAGSIQGLRPMRYEKRVARNRFIFFFALLFLGLLGIAAMIFRHR